VKFFYLITLAVLSAGLDLRAQTNADAAAPTRIESDSVDFDLNLDARKAVYTGNVRVDDPQMKLRCARLTVNLPADGGRVDHIVAETNVVIDTTNANGQEMHATSDRAVYFYEVKSGVTNETVTLRGHAKVENAQGWLTGEPIVWNRANNSLSATNQKMIFRQNLDGAMTETNSPPNKTKKSSAPK
jgi:lipopolysaccharide transport protein LptA